jgi:hypothetical protein
VQRSAREQGGARLDGSELALMRKAVTLARIRPVLHLKALNKAARLDLEKSSSRLACAAMSFIPGMLDMTFRSSTRFCCPFARMKYQYCPVVATTKFLARNAHDRQVQLCT